MARRLLTDARATKKLVAFHEQAWQFGRFSKIAPDAATAMHVLEFLIDESYRAVAPKKLVKQMDGDEAPKGKKR